MNAYNCIFWRENDLGLKGYWDDVVESACVGIVYVTWAESELAGTWY